MYHKLKISVDKNPKTDGVVSCRTVSMREWLMRLFLGDSRKLVVLVPGDSVKEIIISQTHGRSEKKCLN